MIQRFLFIIIVIMTAEISPCINSIRNIARVITMAGRGSFRTTKVGKYTNINCVSGVFIEIGERVRSLCFIAHRRTFYNIIVCDLGDLSRLNCEIVTVQLPLPFSQIKSLKYAPE